MASSPPAPTTPAPAVPALPSRFAQYGENLTAALRTAGAALVGNAALIFFGFVGAHPELVWKALVMGVVFIVIGCIPVAVLERDRLAKNAAEPAPQDKSAKGS